MNQAERRLYLIRYLLAEDRRLAGMEIPPDKKGQEDLLRALMNIRPPKPADSEFLSVQDAYLREERDARGTTDASTLTPVRDNLCLWQGDITTLAAGGIVNAANSALLGCFHPLHGCIDNIIHSRAGVQLRLACQELMEAQGHEEPTGRAKITPAYNLPSRYVLHTVGPVITGRVTGEDERLLASCYRSCLALAAENGLAARTLTALFAVSHLIGAVTTALGQQKRSMYGAVAVSGATLAMTCLLAAMPGLRLYGVIAAQAVGQVLILLWNVGILALWRKERRSVIHA